MGPQEQSKLIRTSRFVEIGHVRIWTARPFAEVVRRLEDETGSFDGPAIHSTAGVVPIQ